VRLPGLFSKRRFEGVVTAARVAVPTDAEYTPYLPEARSRHEPAMSAPIVRIEIVPMDQRLTRKPLPRHVAQVCRNGHLVLGSLQEFRSSRSHFARPVALLRFRNQKCSWPIKGIGPQAWMVGGGQYRPPRYCGECGTPFPWTETALQAAKEYTDDLEQLTLEEKATLEGNLR
jgi:Uncharacterized protein conserved in bacteria (DUF2321)